MASVTLAHIAARLGLAHTTVSRALNGHPKISARTRQQVEQVAREMGYIANTGARNMRSGISCVLGLVLPDIQNEFFAAAASSMAEHCADSGYQLLLGLSGDDPKREEHQFRTMRESRVAGLLIAPCDSPTEATVRMAREIPVVQFLRHTPALGSLGVRADDIQGVREATQHLLLLGHRRIGYIGPPLTLSTGAARNNGWRTAVADAGIDLGSAWAWYGPVRPQAGNAALKELLARPKRPTALVVASSQQMLGVVRAARANDIAVPEALSLVAYGDTPWFEACTPAITAVSLPVAAMCETATSLLFGRLQGHATSAGERVFATALIMRGTTRRAV